MSDPAKAEALSPTIQALTDKEQAPEWERLFGPQFEEFATITISALDSSVSGHLNDTSDALWSVFLDAIEFYFQPGKYRSCNHVEVLILLILGSPPLPRQALSENLQNGLFSRLSLDRQKELCGSIITIGSGSADAVRHLSVLQLSRPDPPIQKPHCISLLAKLLSGAPLLIELVTELRPKPNDVSLRATKRAKVVE